MKALFIFALAAVIHSQAAFAIIDHRSGYPRQVLPPGCLNQVKVANGIFSCDGGQFTVVNGWVNLSGQKLCAFLAATGEEGVLFLEIDNRQAEFTDQYVCTRAQ